MGHASHRLAAVLWVGAWCKRNRRWPRTAHLAIIPAEFTWPSGILCTRSEIVAVCANTVVWH